MNSLKNSPQWINWLYGPPDKNGHRDKKPKNPKTGGNAQTNNPATWSSYEHVNQVRNKFDGIGFTFANGICGIDLDNKHNDPEFENIAEYIIMMMDTYTERSPSGTGYHIIFKMDTSKLPPDYKKRFYQKNPHNGCECYISDQTNRFFTFTGESTGRTEAIQERTNELLMFLDEFMQRNNKENPPQRGNATEDSGVNNSPLSNTNVLSIARRAKNGNKFIALFDQGDISAYNGDDSSADIALANILAFYCQGDFNTVDELFRQSALMRDKWLREDYRTATINKGIEICNGKFYTPKAKKPAAKKNPPAPAIVNRWPGAVYFNPFETRESRHRYAPNDIGAGHFFADVYKNISRYVPESKAWYVYDGRVWRKDVGDIIVGRQAQDLTDYMMDCRKYLESEDAREAWAKFVVARMKKAARDTMLADASKQYAVSITQFDTNPYLFNCQNCTLDLKNFTRHQHRPEDFITKLSNVVFEPATRCNRWETFIDEVMQSNADTARYFQKCLGYALSGDTSEECFFILYGSTTRNGKGTTMETMLHLMGDYGRTAQPETIAQKTNTHSGGPTEDVARLKGARFVNMSEPDKGLRLNAALVKQLTGGDTVTARFLHENSFEYRPEYKLFINTNHRLRVNDDSIFASGRVHEIPFERHFKPEEQDKGLKKLFKQQDNISGIFNWIVDGLKAMRVDGLIPPEAVVNATNQYREESDIVGQFIGECLTNVPGQKTQIKAIHAEYERWCNEYGYGTLNSRNLVSELRKRKYKVEKSTGNQAYLFEYGITSSDQIPIEWQK